MSHAHTYASSNFANFVGNSANHNIENSTRLDQAIVCVCVCVCVCACVCVYLLPGQLL